MRRLVSRFVAAVLVVFSGAGLAQATAAPTPPLIQGEVRKVDKEAGKITLRHEALVNLDMPAMTMVFRVAEPKFLDAVRPGDKVLFVADKVDGQYTVVRIEAAR